jgi:hypothetical protein
VTGRTAACAVAACLALASCTGLSPSASTSAPAFEGTFSAEFGVRTTVRGTRVPDTGITVTWVARSSCGDNGCVATATEFPQRPEGDPRPPTMVFDSVDGHWVSVTAAPAQCPDAAGKPIAVDAWQAFTLDPKPDGSLVGTYTNRSSVGGACFSSTQSVTVKRTGSADSTVHVADPGAQPGRVPSPAAGLWGSYRLVQTNPDTGQLYPPTIYAGNTLCLRSGDRCLSYLVEPTTKALLVMTFAKDGWTSTSAPVQTRCGSGASSTSVVTATMALPQPVTDPISALEGSQRASVAKPCPKTLTLDARLERTGDS